jgi:CO/xanthine dehydrogenase Mo-binding subunit
MDPALAGLAGAAGAALVQAMATDFWSTARLRFTRMVGRAPDAAEGELAGELDESARRVALEVRPEAAVQAERERWTAGLARFLTEHPEAAAEAREFVESVRRGVSADGSQNVSAGRDAFIAGRDQHISFRAGDDER